MCKSLKLKLTALGLLFSLGGLLSASAAAPCPATATHVGSGQSIGTTAKGSGINVQSGALPQGVAPCQTIVVCSDVQYAGTTTYAWAGSTAVVNAWPGLTVPFSPPEHTENVAPPGYTTTVLSSPTDAVCP